MGTAITVLWVAMMTSLVVAHILPHKREPLPDSSIDDPATLTRHWQDSREYMLLKYGPAVLGASSSIVQKLDGPQVRFVANFRLGATFGFAKLKQAMRLKAVGELDSQFELSAFYLDSDLAGYRLRVRGAVRGTELFVDLDKNGQHSISRLQLGRRISLLEAVRPAVMHHYAIKPGATYVLPVADAGFTLQQGQVEMRVLERDDQVLGGRKVAAYRVETRLNDFVSSSWVDRQGNTLKRQVIGQLYMERCTAPEAEKISPVLRESLIFPPLDLEQFKRVQSQTLEQLTDGKQSPLSVLAGLLKTE